MSNNVEIQKRAKKFSVKGKQMLMLYDTDDFKTQLFIRQRLYYEGNSTTPLFTPITRTIAERLRPLVRGGYKTLPFEPRECTACFNNPTTQQGYSEYKVFIPYTPQDNRLLVSLKEIMELQGVEAIKYSGESHTSGTKQYVS